MFDFITSDSHFGHSNVIKFDQRPFANADEMDLALIENWNATVKDKHKHVMHLGDFSFRSTKSIEWYTSRLYGQIHLILGNHDDQSKNCAAKAKHCFASVRDYAYVKKDHQKIVLFHYACRTWRAANRGSWLLFGHSHGRLKPYGKSMDVGCMTNWFKPYSFEEIRAFMASREIEVEDREIHSSALEEE